VSVTLVAHLVNAPIETRADRQGPLFWKRLDSDKHATKLTTLLVETAVRLRAALAFAAGIPQVFTGRWRGKAYVAVDPGNASSETELRRQFQKGQALGIPFVAIGRRCLPCVPRYGHNSRENLPLADSCQIGCQGPF